VTAGTSPRARVLAFGLALALVPAAPLGAAAQGVETVAELAVAPGNLTLTADGRTLLSLHQFYAPRWPVVERLASGELVPFPDTAAYRASGAPPLDAVLGIQADAHGVVWMLDNGMRRNEGRRLVGWDTRRNRLEQVIDLGAPHSPAGAFLNDLAVDRTHGTIYVADPAGGADAAILVVDLRTGRVRRLLQGHSSVVPEPDVELAIDGTPVRIRQADGTVVHPRIGVNPIALDARDRWLYFGPMHGRTLYRIPTAVLRDERRTAEAVAAAVQAYAARPITDGISIDDAGNVYLGDLAANAVGVIGPDRQYRRLAAGPELSWVDAFSHGPDGMLYLVANQLHRSAPLNAGVDESRAPYRLMRLRPLAAGRVGR
jgi:sugar lactone lactonase YvrE